MPPTRVAMVGTRQAMASRATRPKDSSLAGQQQQIGERQDVGDVVELAEEVDAVLNAGAMGDPFRGGAVGAIADHEQARGQLAGDAGEDADHIGGALDGAEVREVHEDLFAVGGVAGASLGALLGAERHVDIAVDEVGDDLDGAFGVEVLDGFFAQVIRNRGDSVALVDAEPCDGQVGMVEADEGDVGAVQGGDEGQALAIAGEHFARQKRRDGVRDGVVDVEQIELVVVGDLGHARGEREVVGRELKERVIGDRNFVEGDVLLAPAEAEGLRIGDEVDLMAGGGQLDAELGSDDAAAAVGGIAGDADLHKEPGYRV